MPMIKCEFYLASAINNKCSENTVNISTAQIGLYGNLFSESLILHTDEHYNIYTKPQKGRLWKLKSTMNVTIGDYGFLLNKVKSPAVSGTIGEAVVIPALTASMGINSNTFGFQRLKSRFKCPDFLVETMPEFDKLWNMTPGSSSKFPPDMPLEVKSRLTRDNGYPHTAVDQLKRYWSECKSIDPQRDGYGIIARVNIASSNITIRYYLFTK